MGHVRKTISAKQKLEKIATDLKSKQAIKAEKLKLGQEYDAEVLLEQQHIHPKSNAVTSETSAARILKTSHQDAALALQKSEEDAAKLLKVSHKESAKKIQNKNHIISWMFGGYSVERDYEDE